MPHSPPKLFYLVLDQGTSSTKIFLFDDDYTICFTERIKHQLHRPAELHVESDPLEILDACRRLLADAIDYVIQSNGRIVTAGMAVQRSTFLFWDKQTIKPLTPAISWQDSRAKAVVYGFQEHADWIQNITGTPLSAHFGAPKFIHLTKQDHALKRQTQSGTVWFGPLSTFLTHSFTGTAVVDDSIASRSLLMNLDQVEWDEDLCNLFDIPGTCLPPLVPTIGNFGMVRFDDQTIPLECVIGDQQAALIGQGGIFPGRLAMNFGTSGSVLFNSGSAVSHIPELISSVLMSHRDKRHYMLEGTINACNSLFYWLESELNIPHKKMLWHERCSNIETDGVFVPGFIGLAAPYWKDGFNTIKNGLDQADINETIRAAMESIGLLAFDIYTKIVKRVPIKTKIVTASGGGARPPLLQFLADILQIPIGHTALKDRTALGVYKLLRGVKGKEIDTQQIECDQVFRPQMDETTRSTKINRWHQALEDAGIR